MPDRRQQIAAFYTAEADHLRNVVARSVRAPRTVIEDACQHAWCQLVRYPHVRLDRDGFWWLHRVATRNVFDLTTRRADLIGLDDPITPDGGTAANAVAGAQDVPTVAEQRELIALLDRLPTRQRRILFLQVCGFTTSEIGRMTGDTPRTIDRQVGRARRTLRMLRREGDAGGR